MASGVRLSAPYHEDAGPEQPPTALTSEPERRPPALTRDVLEEILLRVASPADLARASAACVSFHRLITDHSFLRRYRSIHPPLFLGFVSCAGFHPLQAPHPNAAVARAVDRAADFSFDYLLRPTSKWCRWHPCNVLNGRVLMGCRSKNGAAYLDLAVCDTLSMRYLLLPPITDDLLASIEIQRQNMFHHRASFVLSGGIEDTSFSVILWMQSNTRMAVLVFSSVSGCWSVKMSANSNVLGFSKIGGPVSGQSIDDCFYLKFYDTSTLIKLDLNTMQFCAFDVPLGHDKRQIVIVESGRNKIAMFSLNYEDRSVDYYTFSQNGSENSNEWHMMSNIPFPVDYNIINCFKAEGYIFLESIPTEHEHVATNSVFFSLEIKSFKIEMVSSFAISGQIYFGFPPSMSPIRI